MSFVRRFSQKAKLMENIPQTQKCPEVLVLHNYYTTIFSSFRLLSFNKLTEHFTKLVFGLLVFRHNKIVQLGKDLVWILQDEDWKPVYTELPEVAKEKPCHCSGYCNSYWPV